MQRIAKLLEEKTPDEYGYNTQRWTGPLLIDWIDQQFGVRFGELIFITLLLVLGSPTKRPGEFIRRPTPPSRNDLKKT